ncbi:hypothetical protein E0Z10_g10535 [Xylaria hypoxylon]|uniref:Uncharacterized protein n=1 Tax=Xylaria hypoxylon TaxID=37992 RepID=A0A4Z0YH29_9PEZI|nr:hypothetical protein E0Z10_g10535 [Xylaria hypoxylon]
MVSSAGFSPGHFTFDTIDPGKQWENAACLVEAAFPITFGTRKRMRGFSIFEPEEAPSLLDLAPAIWNSHYLRSTVSHTKNFAVISNIFASSLNGQSPELRRKGAGLLEGASAEANKTPNQESARCLETSIRRMLWDLLQDTLKPTIRASGATKNDISPKVELDSQDYEINEAIVDEEYLEQYYLSDERHYPHETLPPLPSQDLCHYQSNASYNSDLDLEWQQSNDTTFLPWDNQTLGAPESQVGMEQFYSEADTPSDQLLEPYSQHFKSDLSNDMEDHVMSDYIYNEDDNTYGYEYDYIVPAGHGLNDYDLVTTTPCWDDRGEGGTYQEVTEEGIHGLKADEDSLLQGG